MFRSLKYNYFNKILIHIPIVPSNKYQKLTLSKDYAIILVLTNNHVDNFFSHIEFETVTSLMGSDSFTAECPSKLKVVLD